MSKVIISIYSCQQQGCQAVNSRPTCQPQGKSDGLKEQVA